MSELKLLQKAMVSSDKSLLILTAPFKVAQALMPMSFCVQIVGNAYYRGSMCVVVGRCQMSIWFLM